MDVLFNFFKWEPGCGIISSENTWHKVFQLVDIYYF